MQLLENGNYSITNTKTGETREVAPADLTTYGLSAPVEQPANKWKAPLETMFPILQIPQQVASTTGMFKKTINLGKKSVTDMLQSIQDLRSGNVEAVKERAKQPEYKPAGLEAILGPGSQMFRKDMVGASSRELGGRAVEAVAFNKILSGSLKWLTKKGVYSKAIAATEKATTGGTTIDWNKATADAYAKVKTPIGKEKLMQLAASANPAETINPRSALEVRGQLTQAIPKGYFGKMASSIADIINPGSAGERAATLEATNALRQSLSNQIHALVPGTITPDKFYSFYSKIGGDLPAWGRKILIGLLISKVLPKGVKSYFSQLID